MNPRFTKTLGIAIGVLAVFVMFFVVAPTQAVAQGTCPPNHLEIPPGSGNCMDQTGCLPGWAQDANGQCVDVRDGGIDTGIGTNADFASTNNEKAAEFGCNPIGGWSGIQGCLAAIGYTIMSVFAFFLGITGILLNTAIALTVQSMDVYVNGAPNTTTSIELAWRLFRDLGNIIILFVLLFSSIGIILRTDILVPRGTLAKIVMAAFLINFSLFFTKVIIDFSNVLTFTLHKEIEEIGAQTSEDTIAIGVAGAFMKGLAPQKIIKDIDSALRAENGAEISMNIFQQTLLGSLVILVATFVFLVMAVMLLVRFVILLLLLITSPIGVVGGLIPKLASYSKQWWSTLIGQAMFAPVLMLFMLIAILVINSGGLTQAITDTGQLNNISNVEGNLGVALVFISKFLPTTIQYFIVIALMIFGLVIAKSTAGKFGSGAVDWASKKAGSLAFGGIAAGGAYTIGRLGGKLADSQFANNLQASNSFASRLVGRGLINTGKYVGSASYDVRGTAVGKELGAGKAAVGYIKRQEEEKKRIADATKKLKPVDTTVEEREKLELELKDKTDELAAWDKKIAEARTLENSGVTGFALHSARDARVDAEVKQAEAKQKLEEDPKYKKLKDLEALSISVAKKREEEAKSDIARLANVLEDHQVQQAREVSKILGDKDKSAEDKSKALSTLNKTQQDLAVALNKLGGAQKQSGDIQKATQAAWADRNIKESGPVGEVVVDIRKEHSKTKASKILEDFLRESDRKDAAPKEEKPPEAPKAA